MDALIMCGGRGTRLDAPVEKPLLEIRGRPMVDRVRDALEASEIDTVHAVTSPNAPATAEHLSDLDRIETPGEGYVQDLDAALRSIETPVLTCAADLPLLSEDAVDSVLDAHHAGSMTVCVPAALKRLLDLSLGTTFEDDGRTLAPTGLNVVAQDTEDEILVTYDVRLAVNVNRKRDAEIAEALCDS